MPVEAFQIYTFGPHFILSYSESMDKTYFAGDNQPWLRISSSAKWQLWNLECWISASFYQVTKFQNKYLEGAEILESQTFIRILTMHLPANTTLVRYLKPFHFVVRSKWQHK